MSDILMVTPYAPYRDGIAAYAVQEVRVRRAAGESIDVLSPLPSAAQHHLSLGGVRGMAALVKRARNHRSVILQFSPEMLFGACRSPLQRIAVWGLIEGLAAVTELEIRLHEIEYGPIERNPVERAAARRALRAADSVTVHTGREVEELIDRLGLRPDDVTVIDHGSAFVGATTTTRVAARTELGLEPGEHVFLCIGFVQEHKGFDLAVDAFAQSGLAGQASLHIVGSVRVDHRDLLAYARRLRALCSATAGATFHERYVSDDTFDAWIVAADTVVLPYREIWSSGVMERAKLYNRAVIATDVGGMGDQAPDGTLFFTDRATLAKAMQQRVETTADDEASDEPDDSSGDSAAALVEAPALAWDVDPAAPDRTAIEAQIRARVRAEHGVDSATTTHRAGAAVDPLLAIGELNRHHAVSARRGVSFAKRAIRRALNWEIAPISDQVESLQRATIEAIAKLESRLDD